MRTIRIGGGAGYGGDRIEPALDLIRFGNLDYIIFECLAERTIAIAQQEKEKAQRTQSVDKVEKQIQVLLTGELEKDGEALLSLPEPTFQSVFDTVKQGLEALVERRKQEVEQTSAQLDFAFDFLEAAFGRGQELVWFVTQLAGGYYSSWFIAQFGCVRFDQYNESLLFEKRRSQLLDQVDRLEQS